MKNEQFVPLIQNKQRILFVGKEGVSGLIDGVVHVLNYAGKKFDLLNGERNELTNAPIILIVGNEELIREVGHHFLVIAKIGFGRDSIQNQDQDFVDEIEKLAEKTPKAGTLVYCDDDDFVSIIGRKERDGIKGIPYKKLDIKDSNLSRFSEGELLDLGGVQVIVRELGVTEEVFFKALSELNR